MTPASPSASAQSPRRRFRLETSNALQVGLLLDIALRLLVWGFALAFTVHFAARERFLARWAAFDLTDPQRAITLARELGLLVLVFNVVYLLVLVVLRMPIPAPRPGRKPLPRPWLDRDIWCAGALGALARARYQPIFPAFLVPQLAGIQPFRWLLALQFGPRTQSSFWSEPTFLDPTHVRIGRNVGVGHGTTIAAHLVARDWIEFAPVVIEDDVLIGGHCVIAGGVRVRPGAVIGIGSYIKPGTVVGANEFWAGVPARKIKELPPIAERDSP